MSAFKFIGYYDLLNDQMCSKKEKEDNDVVSVYFSKEKNNYLFLNKERVRMSNSLERQIIEEFVIQEEKKKKALLLKTGAIFLTLALAMAVKSCHFNDKDSKQKVVESSNEETFKVINKARNIYSVNDTDIKNKLVSMLNTADVSLLDVDYRILYYLYYATVVDGGVEENFLDTMSSHVYKNNRATYHDVLRFCISNEFNYSNVISDPERDSSAVTYENMDVFLEFNILLNEEALEGNVSMSDYQEYMTRFGASLKLRDRDLHRVWSYHSSNLSMFGKFINLKSLIVSKSLNLTSLSIDKL